MCLIFADIAISTGDPWREFGLLLTGIVTPISINRQPRVAIAYTLAFALLGVAFANVMVGLALIFHYRIVRVGCAFIRAIHELFWALIFLQMFGLSPLTGVLAITIPYAGIIAKVAEILEKPISGLSTRYRWGRGGHRRSCSYACRMPGRISAPIPCIG